MNAQKTEAVDTDALIVIDKTEIEDLKRRLKKREREAEPPARTGWLLTKRSVIIVTPPHLTLTEEQKTDGSKAMRDLNAHIQQLTKLILTSQSGLSTNIIVSLISFGPVISGMAKGLLRIFFLL